MRSRLEDLDTALERVGDGMTVAIGGAPLSRKPIAAIRRLIERGVRDLEVVTFTGSLDVELLVRAGAVRAVRSSHVSLGSAGAARAFAAAVERGEVEDLEESEWMLLGRLRAAAAGMPFLATRAALDSQLAAERGLREVEDPYTGERLLAVPALSPDVAIVHAWRSDAAGNVQSPSPPDHLWDVDLLMARAAVNVIVTVEREVDAAQVCASADQTALFGFELDSVVVTPGGAAPTAAPPDYPADTSILSHPEGILT